MYLSFPVVKQG